MTKTRKGKRKTVKVLIIVAALAALIVLFKTVPIVDYLLKMVDWIEDMGSVGYLIFICVYIVLTVLAGPAWALTLAAGFAYGLLRGTILVSIGSTLGATLAFLIGRYVAREAILRKVGEKPRFRSMDEAVGRRGFFIVFLTRLSPVFPFTLLNYSYGLTKVRLVSYFFASWIGMLPGTLMYVYLGTLITNLSQVASDETPTSAYQNYFYYFGLAVTVAVTLYITRLARNALKQAAGGREETAAPAEKDRMGRR